MRRGLRVPCLEIFVAAVGLVAQSTKKAPTPHGQPIPYSHKQHPLLGLKCQECHTKPDPGEVMTFPATDKRMPCHAVVARDKPSIKKLSAFAKSNEPTLWVRVYSIPDWVDFSHKAHPDAGATCENCHGRVAERDSRFKAGDISMAGCMDPLP